MVDLKSAELLSLGAALIALSIITQHNFIVMPLTLGAILGIVNITALCLIGSGIHRLFIRWMNKRLYGSADIGYN